MTFLAPSFGTVVFRAICQIKKKISTFREFAFEVD